MHGMAHVYDVAFVWPRWMNNEHAIFETIKSIAKKITWSEFSQIFHIKTLCDHIRIFALKRKKKQMAKWNFLMSFNRFNFLSIKDLHSAQNADEKLHQPIGYVGRSNMCSIWPVFHVIIVTGNFQLAKNSP